jgi:hypothetical protein
MVELQLESRGGQTGRGPRLQNRTEEASARLSIYYGFISRRKDL